MARGWQLAYDAVLLCAHSRTLALRTALALEVVEVVAVCGQAPPARMAASASAAAAAAAAAAASSEPSLAMLRFGLLPKFLAVATTELTASPMVALGRIAPIALHLPSVQRLVRHLAVPVDEDALAALAAHVWSRLSAATPERARSPWLRSHNYSLPALALMVQHQMGSSATAPAKRRRAVVVEAAAGHRPAAGTQGCGWVFRLLFVGAVRGVGACERGERIEGFGFGFGYAYAARRGS